MTNQLACNGFIEICASSYFSGLPLSESIPNFFSWKEEKLHLIHWHGEQSHRKLWPQKVLFHENKNPQICLHIRIQTFIPQNLLYIW